MFLMIFIILTVPTFREIFILLMTDRLSYNWIVLTISLFLTILIILVNSVA